MSLSNPVIKVSYTDARKAFNFHDKSSSKSNYRLINYCYLH